MADILDKRKQVARQCLAVAHLARALARVNDETAGTVSDRILDIVGERTAQHMEILGDMLNGMDAVDDEEDAWLEPVFAGAHAMFADAVAKAWAAAPVPELAESDRHVLIHALTGGGDGHVYRNYYNALSGHTNIPSIKRLIAAGLMKEGSPGYFHCTEAGAKAVGLHLPNDSRAAAPVPARECQHDWKPRWQQSLGEGETRWIECELCGAKRFPPPAADK